MQRRNFVSGSAAAMLAGTAEADTPKSHIFNLVYYYLHSGTQVDRTTQYLGNVFLPAAKRAGIVQAGFFSPVIGERSPYILSVVSYASLTAFEAVEEKLTEDKEFLKGWEGYNSTDPPYARMESVLLRGFDRIPALDPPPVAAKQAARIFELRTYESMNEKASQRKIKMFEDGEAAIFRRLGMTPVFFGQGLTGSRLPSLTYMLAFDDLAAREKLWRSFGADPEWQKLRAQPGLSDAEIVSNISSAILRPLASSPIR